MKATRKSAVALLLLWAVAVADAAVVELLVAGRVTQVQNSGGTSSPPAAIGDPVQMKVSYDTDTPANQTLPGYYGGVIQQYLFGAGLASVSFTAGTSTFKYGDGISATTQFAYPGGGCLGYVAYGSRGVLAFSASPATGGSLNLDFSVLTTPVTIGGPYPSVPPLLRSPNLPASMSDFGLLTPPPSEALGGCPGAFSSYTASVVANGWKISTELDPLTIAYTGTAAPAVSLSSQSLVFADQGLGNTSPSQAVILTNSGTASLAVSSITVFGLQVSDFVLATDQCSGKTVAPGASCSFGAAFRPTRFGARSAGLLIASNAARTSVSLSGNGVVSSASPAPIVRSLSVSSGTNGTPVIIRGRNFGASQGPGFVMFGTASATITQWSDQRIHVTAPAIGSGPYPVTVGTVGGLSNSTETFSYPTILPVVVGAHPAPQPTPQSFPAFIWRRAPLQLAFVTVAGDHARDVQGIDECYDGAMSAAGKAQGQQIVDEALAPLADVLFSYPIGLISTGTDLGDFFLKLGAHALNAGATGQDIPATVIQTTADEIAGYIMAKAVGDYEGRIGYAGIKLTAQLYKELLTRDRPVPWKLSGNNQGTQGYRAGLQPLTTIDASVVYSPWTYYTTAVITATCQSPMKTERKVFTVTYKVNKSSTGSAEPELGTLLPTNTSNSLGTRTQTLP